MSLKFVADFAAVCVSLIIGLFVQSAAFASETNNNVVVLSLETTSTGIEINFDRQAELRIIHLNNPPRIVLDLPETNFSALDRGVRLPELIKAIRYGLMTPGQSRIILTLSLPAIASLLQSDSSAQTHEIAFAPVDAAEFTARATDDAALQSPVATAKSDRLGEAAKGPKPFTLVIDPGHGGIDG
ncbi:MAG: AMIN domain-containing protein, partial [Notoacmeibacter sp.]